MDGNRRFARDVGADSVVTGHVAGADKLDEVLSWCEELEIDIITVWIFSLDNFTRGDDEVAGLMNLFERKFMELVTSQKIHKNQIRICSIGRLDALPSRVRKSILLRVSPHLILCLLILRSQAGVLDARRAPGTPALSALA